MDDARFWSVVASLGPGLATGRLAMVLTSFTRADLSGFRDCLADVEHELDTRDHRAHACTAFELVRSGQPATSTAADRRCPADFGELQVTVVAHGQDAWRAVVAVPTLLSGGWPTGLGRQFLAAVTTAWRGTSPVLRPV